MVKEFKIKIKVPKGVIDYEFFLLLMLEDFEARLEQAGYEIVREEE